MRKISYKLIKRAGFPWHHKINKINSQKMRFLMKPWSRHLAQHNSRYLLPSKRTEGKKGFKSNLTMYYCLCTKARREIGLLSITSTFPSDTASASCQVSGKRGTAGAHTNTLHDPLIPSPSCERKISLPLHMVFETLASNQWSLMKWNLLLTHPGRGNPQWQPSLGS